MKNRYENLYEQASKEYAEACREHNWRNVRGWKKRMEWLDRKVGKQ